jgi:Spy/CpxP family protein refolding chaperone
MVAALGVMVVAVGGTACVESPDLAENTQRLTQVPRAHGVVQMLGEALTDVALAPIQESVVEALGAQVEPLQIQVDQAENDLLKAIADQVKAHSMDRAALEPNIAAYVEARTKLTAPLRSAVESLHDILQPMQRADFAEALACRVHAVTQAIQSTDTLDEFATQMGLTDAQKAMIRDAMMDFKQSLLSERESLHYAIEAFRGDTFSVEEYLPQSEVAGRATSRAKAFVDVTFAILSILGPAQRDALAVRLVDAATKSDEPEAKATAVQPLISAGPENVDTAAQELWAAGRVRRGPYGGVRGGVVVGGVGGYYGRRVGLYPPNWGWGYGW